MTDVDLSTTRWRVITTDSENDDGVAPVCPRVSEHAWPDPEEDGVDDTGVYDCCPFPQLEAGSPQYAQILVNLLNEALDLKVLRSLAIADAMERVAEKLVTHRDIVRSSKYTMGPRTEGRVSGIEEAATIVRASAAGARAAAEALTTALGKLGELGPR